MTSEKLADSLLEQIRHRSQHPAIALSGLSPLVSLIAAWIADTDSRVATLEVIAADLSQGDTEAREAAQLLAALILRRHYGHVGIERAQLAALAELADDEATREALRA